MVGELSSVWGEPAAKISPGKNPGSTPRGGGPCTDGYLFSFCFFFLRRFGPGRGSPGRSPYPAMPGMLEAAAGASLTAPGRGLARAAAPRPLRARCAPQRAPWSAASPASSGTRWGGGHGRGRGAEAAAAQPPLARHGSAPLSAAEEGTNPGTLHCAASGAGGGFPGGHGC